MAEAISKWGPDAWTDVVSFSDYGLEIRRAICSPSAVELMNAEVDAWLCLVGVFPARQPR